jgi:hypothetical protein
MDDDGAELGRCAALASCLIGSASYRDHPAQNWTARRELGTQPYGGWGRDSNPLVR